MNPFVGLRGEIETHLNCRFAACHYLSREGRLLVRRFDRKTVILGTREELDGHKLAMGDPLPNKLREVAQSMQDCEVFVIANTQDHSYFGDMLANSGIGPVDELLQKVRFIYGASKFLTASVSLGETPRLQILVRTEAQERNHEVTMAVTELRDQTKTLIRDNLNLLADGTFFKDKESVAAATASLLLSTSSTKRGTASTISRCLRRCRRFTCCIRRWQCTIRAMEYFGRRDRRHAHAQRWRSGPCRRRHVFTSGAR